MRLQGTAIRANTDSLGSMKSYKFSASKDSRAIERSHLEWEEALTNHKSDKELIANGLER